MEKSFVITRVRNIFNIANPIVVFDVQGGTSIVRNPKQAITDLQNSGRALTINAKEFANGIEGLSQATKAAFQTALFDCVGATLTGDITATKAGDEYPIRAGHPALTDAKHELFGKVKEGDKLKAEKDSNWVEGFLSIPLTPMERQQRDIASGVASLIAGFMGYGATAPVATSNAPVTFEDEADDLPTKTQNEAFGNGATKPEKVK